MLNQNIIKTALLGLGSKQMDLNVFPKKIQEVLEGKEQNEELFLDALSLTFQYLNSGNELEKIEKINTQINVCPEEILAYVSNNIQLALKECSRSNFLDYSLSYIYLLAEKSISENKILKLENFTKIVSKLNGRQNKFIRNSFYKSFNYRYIYNIRNFEKTIISSFGNTGNWIYEMIENKKQIENDDLDAKGRRILFENYWYFEKEKSLEFLEEYFAHERIGNQTFYLNTIRKTLKKSDSEIIEFFDVFFSENTSKSKSIIQLRTVYDTVKIFIDKNLEGTKEIEAIFVEIWKPRNLLNRALKLKPRKELVKILLELDKYLPESFVEEKNIKDLDLKLYFLFQIVNIEKAITLLKVNQEKYLMAVSEIKSLHKNKSYNLLNSLTVNIFNSNNKKAAKEIIKITSKKSKVNLDLLMLFSDIEIVKILESNLNILSPNYYDVIEFIITELNLKTRWSAKLTRQVLDYILDNQSLYSGNNFYKTLWLCLPFFHKDVNKIVISVANNKKHDHAWKKNEIQEYILNDLKKILTLNEELHLLKNN